jgi:hypothetical protein
VRRALGIGCWSPTTTCPADRVAGRRSDRQSEPAGLRLRQQAPGRRRRDVLPAAGAARRTARRGRFASAGAGRCRRCSTWSRWAPWPTWCGSTRNNRLLVAAGLKRIRAGRACGRASGAAVRGGRARRSGAPLGTDLGFAVGPRINAAGRLSDISLGIECLLTDDPDARCVRTRQQQLDAINRERREIESDDARPGPGHSGSSTSTRTPCTR